MQYNDDSVLKIAAAFFAVALLAAVVIAGVPSKLLGAAATPSQTTPFAFCTGPYISGGPGYPGCPPGQTTFFANAQPGQQFKSTNSPPSFQPISSPIVVGQQAQLQVNAPFGICYFNSTGALTLTNNGGGGCGGTITAVTSYGQASYVERICLLNGQGQNYFNYINQFQCEDVTVSNPAATTTTTTPPLPTTPPATTTSTTLQSAAAPQVPAPSPSARAIVPSSPGYASYAIGLIIFVFYAIVAWL